MWVTRFTSKSTLKCGWYNTIPPPIQTKWWQQWICDSEVLYYNPCTPQVPFNRIVQSDIPSWKTVNHAILITTLHNGGDYGGTGALQIWRYGFDKNTIALQLEVDLLSESKWLQILKCLFWIMTDMEWFMDEFGCFR